MKVDLEETDAPTETVPWRPGMCTTPDCGRLVPDNTTFCAPCTILFGAYTELIAHDDVEEWRPPEPAPEPDKPTPAKRRPRKRPTVPPVEGVQPETS